MGYKYFLLTLYCTSVFAAALFAIPLFAIPLFATPLLAAPLDEEREVITLGSASQTLKISILR